MPRKAKIEKEPRLKFVVKKLKRIKINEVVVFVLLLLLVMTFFVEVYCFFSLPFHCSSSNLRDSSSKRRCFHALTARTEYRPDILRCKRATVLESAEILFVALYCYRFYSNDPNFGAIYHFINFSR